MSDSIGVRENSPFQEYASDPGINFSKLKLIDESPLDFYLSLNSDEEDESTDSQSFGRAYHHYILEQKTFLQYFFPCEKITRRGAAWEELKLSAETTGREIIWHEDLAIIKKMKEMLASHSLVPGLFAGSKREMSIFWDEPGISEPHRCKARIDLYNPELKILADLKTTTSSHPRKFYSSIFDWNYNGQMAWYRRALELFDSPVEQCVIIAQSKVEPYHVMFYELHPELLEVSAFKNEERFKQYSACHAAKQWPGYPDVPYVVNVPDWMKK